MRKDLIDIVCCPEDKAKLELEDAQLDDHGDIVSGTLRCTECGFGYPVEEGIPNLLPPQYHVKPGAPPKGTGKAGTQRVEAGSAGAPVSGARDAPADPHEAAKED